MCESCDICEVIEQALNEEASLYVMIWFFWKRLVVLDNCHTELLVEHMWLSDHLSELTRKPQKLF